METIRIKVNRSDVYDEVGKATDYAGSKMIMEDSGARERIYATQRDLKELRRFWEEACVAANERLREMYVGGSMPSAEDYEAELSVSVAFDESLLPSVESAMRSYFIMQITGKWYVLSNKGESAAYFAAAEELMEDVRRKLYSRRMKRSPRTKATQTPETPETPET